MAMSDRGNVLSRMPQELRLERAKEPKHEGDLQYLLEFFRQENDTSHISREGVTIFWPHGNRLRRWLYYFFSIRFKNLNRTSGDCSSPHTTWRVFRILREGIWLDWLFDSLAWRWKGRNTCASGEGHCDGPQFRGRSSWLPNNNTQRIGVIGVKK